MPRSPQIRVGQVYWRRQRALGKTRVRVVFVVCTAGAFIGCVDNVKSEYMTKGEKMSKVG